MVTKPVSANKVTVYGSKAKSAFENPLLFATEQRD